MIELIIPGEPISKLRPRFKKNGSTYDPQHIQKSCQIWFLKEFLQKNYRTVSLPLKGSLECELYFYLEPPKSWPKTTHNLISWQLYDHTHKPDIDNLVKFYLDVMNGIIYEDDRQIGNILVQKYYSKNPRTEIRIVGRSKNLLEKVEDMLSCLSVEEFGELAGDLELVADCLSLDFIQSGDEARIKLQLEAAYTLSIFADRYGSMLHGISKKYPGIWKHISEFEKKIVDAGPNGVKSEKCLNYLTDNHGNEFCASG